MRFSTDSLFIKELSYQNFASRCETRAQPIRHKKAVPVRAPLLVTTEVRLPRNEPSKLLDLVDLEDHFARATFARNDGRVGAGSKRTNEHGVAAAGR